MKFEVPFLEQRTAYDCGPTTLQMVLEYIGKKPYDREELQNLVDSERSGATSTIALAVAAAKLGFEVELYTNNLGFNPENYDLDFYKKVADSPESSQVKLEKLKSEAVKLNVKLIEKSISTEEILSKLKESCASLILLDWNKIKGKEGYQGHFVPIVGYDEENVLIHNPGTFNPGKFIQIKKDLFDISRKAKGTDEDIIFIRKPISK